VSLFLFFILNEIVFVENIVYNIKYRCCFFCFVLTDNSIFKCCR